jgi:hypothetical protein
MKDIFISERVVQWIVHDTFRDKFYMALFSYLRKMFEPQKDERYEGDGEGRGC